MFNFPRFTAISIAFALMSLFTACGQTGPLYLPSKPAPAATSSPPEPVPAGAPVPASK